ncbi:oxygen-regulated protein 1-like [Chelmon rostratus]|uniref:oxygen-regulated protein 1-like n=1 Tax=Chelmon rostratus TaxID=109905 RepID=UPI001BE7D9FF|nr:oxygen-regulated protein 1-like [Chelmon rostratus]
MMNETGLRRILPDQSSGSGHSFGTPRHPSIIDPILSKRVCFYKSGDPQFSGLRMVINNRTFKTFDALLDSLSKKVPLPFGVRNITTPRGVHAIYTLDELEDGKSYICSDSRKVKPINLALARKKLPPWYHARPVSSRRRTVQQARFFPGQNIHKKELVVMRTPKRLLVFQNGDPIVKHTVVLNKRTTPTFESILEYISELLQFHVVKLHTSDGRRVDGLPGLILCSGIVVAAGREPFRPATYNVQKSPAPTMLPTSRMHLRRLKAFNRKKKSLSYTSKSRKFSPSSERYIVNRIHDSIAESSCDLPSYPTNSMELESGHMLESVAETEGDICLGDGAGGQDCLLPTEDDIEKSFRVNQDGSMTVEMKVRLTIKEEETIHWTTTLTRSSVANQLNATCLPQPEAEQEISSLKSNILDLQSPAASIDTINKDKTEDNNDEDPPSLGNGTFSESGNEEDNVKEQTVVVSPKRAPTPGHKQIRKKQASVESIKSLTAEGFQEGYCYREHTEHGAMTEQYCMFKQSSTKPVPKPRRFGSVDANNINCRNEGLTTRNMDELNVNNVSCAEALKMISSLREIASIEDSHKLKVSLSNLQRSASKQLLESWKGFQELSEKCKSRSSTPNGSEQELADKASPEKDCDTDENGIDEIMDNLDIPVKLKEELATLSVGGNSGNDDKEKLSARISEKLDLSPKDSHLSTEDVANVDDAAEDETVNVDVRFIIKKFTDINQPKQPSKGSIKENAKHKPAGQATKDKDSKYGENGVAKCPPAEPNDEQTHEARNLHSPVLLVKRNEEGMQSVCMDAVNQENQGEKSQEQGHDEESNQEEANMNGVVNSKKNLEQDSCTSEVEEKDIKVNELQVHSEESMSVPEKEQTNDDEAGSEQEEQNMLNASEDLEQKVSCEQSVSSSEAGEQHSSEEEPEVECGGLEQESRESDDLSHPESHSEEEEEKQPSSNYYVELNVRGKGRTSSLTRQSESLSEEEQPEVECTELSNKDPLSHPASPSNSDHDELSSEEGEPEVACKELKVIIEESLSSNEEEQESMGDDGHVNDVPRQIRKHTELKTLIEEAEEDRVSSDDEEQHSDKTQISDQIKSQNTVEGDLSNLIENQDPYTKKDNSSLVKSDSLVKHDRFNADEDSGNDHSSYEDHVEVEQPKVEDEQISSSNEEELSYYEKESNSEEEHANVDRYTEDYQPSSLVTQSEVKKYEKAVEQLKNPPEEIISQSIAERVTLLEKQVADAQNRDKSALSSHMRRFSQRNAPLESDLEDSPPELPTSESSLGTRSAPQSSLSFSYDSSGVVTTEPEGNRVRSIREMFLAKSATDIQHGHRRFPSPNTSELSELRTETSASGGYQSQTSSELSSGEDDSARKSITKGFVRRTIERLYGKKDVNPDEEASERPPSAPKQKKKDHSNIFSPFHIARSKAMSELSYFNSTNALDTLSEATRCVAFNAQVGPGDSISTDNGQWLFRENTQIRKSVSDPVGINKTLRNSPEGDATCEDTEENTPYSLFSTKSEELEDKKSFSRKCTYFSLPHASDSDACQDDLSTVSKSSVTGDSILDTKDNPEDTKMWAERNGTLPGVSVSDFKMMDNKVHPLIERPPDGEVVVAQPGRGQGVMNRRLQEPDMLDLLYNFCGQNCPIL